MQWTFAFLVALDGLSLCPIIELTTDLIMECNRVSKFQPLLHTTWKNHFYSSQPASNRAPNHLLVLVFVCIVYTDPIDIFTVSFTFILRLAKTILWTFYVFLIKTLSWATTTLSIIGVRIVAFKFSIPINNCWVPIILTIMFRNSA